MNRSLLVLAAGMGSRYGGLKQMDPIGPNGEFILDYSVKDSLAAGIDKVVFVIRKDIEKDFRDMVGRRWEAQTDVHYAMQELGDLPEGFTLPPERKKPWGTAHAILAARKVVKVKLNADFLGQTADKPNDYCMVAYRLDKTLSKFGGVSRGICTVDEKGMLVNIVEKLELKRCEDGKIRDGEEVFPDETPISMNMFGFKCSYIDLLEAEFPTFLKSAAGNPKAEYQMPTALGKFLRAGMVSVKVMRTSSSWFGITSREDREEVAAHLAKLK